MTTHSISAIGASSSGIKQEKGIKHKIKTRKNKKIFVHWKHVENPNKCTNEWLKLINWTNKIAEYEVNKQKSILFLHINSKRRNYF